MGPPEEMKQLEFLVGDWDFMMQLRFEPTDTFWMTTEGNAKYEYVFGGAAMMSTISEPPFMGMTFAGGSIIYYDRDRRQWQIVYIDNMSAGLSLFTGSRTKDGWVFLG